MLRKDILRASLPDVRSIPKGPRLKPGGIAEIYDELGYRAFYTSTCKHCQRITYAKNGKEMRENTDICRGCMHLICLHCARKPCMPWEKQCEYQERAYLEAKLIRASWRCY